MHHDSSVCALKHSVAITEVYLGSKHNYTADMTLYKCTVEMVWYGTESYDANSDEYDNISTYVYTDRFAKPVPKKPFDVSPSSPNTT